MKIRLLLIETDAHNLQRIVGELHRTGFDLDWECVERLDEFQDCLERLEKGVGAVDLIVSEHNLQDFDVSDAIQEVKHRALEIPVIVLSDVVNEEVIVKMMRLGVADFIYKGRLSRLGPAIVQAVYHFGMTEKKWIEGTTGISRVNRLASIFDIGRRAASILNIKDLMDETVRLIALRLGYSGVTIRLDDGHWAAYPSGSVNGHGPKPIVSTGFADAKHLNGFHLPDNASGKEDHQPKPDEEHLSFPLKVRQGKLGTLTLRNDSRGVRDDLDTELLEILADQVAIAIENSKLFTSLQNSNARISDAYDQTLRGWSHALELRDDETREHTDRVAEMSVRLGREMGLGEDILVHLRRGALLHDIGKLGVPDRILMKEDALTEEEWDVMRRHPEFAHQMLSSISYLQPALEIPYYHHEKWDGTGYPFGLKGEEIPLSARIFAVADVWDALRSPRPYRSTPWSEKNAVEYIIEQSGRHFDPAVVRAFLPLVCAEHPELIDQIPR
ncbi:MAG TPA: HD domain-containing phosphohydrolase [Anaerolineales bacterium]|nr:HD domain-containing phosphohydrolase [Anaerolineales bacterium]